MKFLLLAAALAMSGSVFAECEINGEIYPEEAVVNGYKCVDGTWTEE